jgi:hypothetical protein
MSEKKVRKRRLKALRKNQCNTLALPLIEVHSGELGFTCPSCDAFYTFDDVFPVLDAATLLAQTAPTTALAKTTKPKKMTGGVHLRDEATLSGPRAPPNSVVLTSSSESSSRQGRNAASTSSTL